MLTKIIFFLSILIFFFIGTLFSNQFITVEETGLSIIKEDINKSRKEAINDALKKALNSVVKQYNKNYSEIENFNDFIEGYEVIEEKQAGNILSEKLKIYINIKLLLQTINSKNNEVPLYAITKCFFQNNNSLISDNFCNKRLRKSVSIVNNLFFIDVNSNREEELFNHSKDILIIVKYYITNLRKIYSINKQFVDINLTINIFDPKNNIIKSLNKNFKVISHIGENPSKFFPKNIFTKLPTIIENYRKNIATNEANITQITFIAQNPKSYNNIRQLEKLFEKFNIKNNLILIKDKSFVYKISVNNPEHIYKIIKFSKLNYNYLKINGKTIIISFD